MDRKKVFKLVCFLSIVQAAGLLFFTHYNFTEKWLRKMFSDASSDQIQTPHQAQQTLHVQPGLSGGLRFQDDLPSRLPPAQQVYTGSYSISSSISVRPTPHPSLPTEAAIPTAAKSSTRAGEDRATATAIKSSITAYNKPTTQTDDQVLAERIQEVTRLLNKQLSIEPNKTQFMVKRGCAPKPTWNYACVHPKCSQLSEKVEHRVKSLISNRTLLDTEQDQLLQSVAAQIPINDVILMTATSSNHFNEMQAMLKYMHKTVFPEMTRRENFSMVLWDIGLTSEQRTQMEKCCRCQVVSFPFEKFPPGIRDLRCYMWKPLVIRMTQLRTRKFLVWQDASIRYNTYPGPIFDNAMRNGLQLIRQKIGVSIPHRTLPETFTYLGQTPCDFLPYPEIASGFAVYKNDPLVLQAVTEPWAKCGFEQSCMCPKHSGKSYRCFYGPCHRFDQSALGVITTTLFSKEAYRISIYEQEMKEFIWVGRNDMDPDYFNSTGCLDQ